MADDAWSNKAGNRDGHAAEHPQPQGSVDADVAVIGGGMVGISPERLRCGGSRFNRHGRMMQGPAVRDMKRYA